MNPGYLILCSVNNYRCKEVLGHFLRLVYQGSVCRSMEKRMLSGNAGQITTWYWSVRLVSAKHAVAFSDWSSPRPKKRMTILGDGGFSVTVIQQAMFIYNICVYSNCLFTIVVCIQIVYFVIVELTQVLRKHKRHTARGVESTHCGGWGAYIPWLGGGCYLPWIGGTYLWYVPPIQGRHHPPPPSAGR